MRQAIYLRTPFNLDDRQTIDLQPGWTVQDVLDNSFLGEEIYRQPIIPVLNREELCQKDFDREIKPGDLLIFQAVPGDPISAAAAWLVANWVTVAVAIGVSLLVGYTLRPGLPGSAELRQGSPNYNISTQSNKARPGQPKPRIYGTFRTYPDVDSDDYYEFDANGDQVVYQRFSVGIGELDIDESSMRYDNTPLSSFDNVEYEIIPPGETGSFYPKEVYVASELSSLELDDLLATNWFTINDVATQISRVAYDMQFPGLYKTDDSGNLQNYNLSWRLELQEIDDDDLDVGSVISVPPQNLSASSADVIMRTYYYNVSPGRYKARWVRLTQPKDNPAKFQDRMIVMQLKGYAAEVDKITDTTRIAIIARESQDIGNQTLSKFNLKSSGKVYTWSSSEGWSDEPVVTSNPAWIMADICRASYGGNRADSRYNLPQLEALAGVYDADGVEFNGVFDTRNTVFKALQQVGTIARTQVIDQAGYYDFILDADVEPTLDFTSREIKRGSLATKVIPITSDTPDSIRGWFFDKDQDHREVSTDVIALPGGSTDNPEDIKLFGIDNNDQAFDHVMWRLGENFYRRRQIRFEVGMVGRILKWGSTCRVSSVRIGLEGADQVGGEVESIDPVDPNVLNLSVPVDGVSNPYIFLRRKNGTWQGPFEVSVIAPRQVRVLETWEDDQIVFEAGFKNASFAIGTGTDFAEKVKVVKAKPTKYGTLLEGFFDSPEPYTIANGVPVPPINQLPSLQSLESQILDLQHFVTGSQSAPEVRLRWTSKNSRLFEVEYSVDDGATYIPIGNANLTDHNFVHYPDPDDGTSLKYRVAGRKLFRGPWSTPVDVDISFSSPAVPFTPTDLALRESFVGPILKIQWQSDHLLHRVVYKAGSSIKITRDVEGNEDDLDYLTARNAGLGRNINIEVWAISAQGVLSASPATLTVNNPAPAVLSNFEINAFIEKASITFTLPSDPDFSGVSVWVSPTSGFTPNNSTLVVKESTWPVIPIPLEAGVEVYVKAAAVDYWGDSGLNYTGEYSVIGGGVDVSAIQAELDLLAEDLADAEADLFTLEGKFPITSTDISEDAITAPKIAANAVEAEAIKALAVTTSKLAALAVTADKLAVNSVTADKIQALSITAAKIAANAVTADKMSVATLSAITANLGEITGGSLNIGNKFIVASDGTTIIRSGTSGARQVIEEDRISVYDSSGTLVCRMGRL